MLPYFIIFEEGFRFFFDCRFEALPKIICRCILSFILRFSLNTCWLFLVMICACYEFLS